MMKYQKQVIKVNTFQLSKLYLLTKNSNDGNKSYNHMLNCTPHYFLFELNCL